MATWDENNPSVGKFETSPAESLLSAPGEMYASLFPSQSPAPAASKPAAVMTPPSLASESKQDAALYSPRTTASAEVESLASTPAPEDPAPATDKKPAKKRKSWGQVLPEPKTNLPPR